MRITLTDQFLIAVSGVFDERQDQSGFKMMVSAHYIDQERDRYERKIRSGLVYSAPTIFSERNHMPIDPGIPNARLYVGHDAIQQKINEGYKWGNHNYHPGATEHFKYLTVADYARMITAKAGDQVYFHPSVTEPDNYFGQWQGMELYRAQVHEIIAVGTIPQAGWILVEPHLEQKDGDGIVVTTEDVDKMLEGTIKYCRPGGPFNSGDHVFFQEGSDWSFEINGERLFAMLEENIVLQKIE